MKSAIWIMAILVIGFLLYKYAFAKQNKATSSFEIQFDTSALEPSINVVEFQDASGSITQNGVELISSTVFTPYFKDNRRDIQLSFGIINGLTARKLLTIELPANRLRRPIMPDFEVVPFGSRNDFKKRFKAAQEKYEADSTVYMKDRMLRFADFSKKVDSMITPYRVKLSRSTDLVPAIKIADKVFNYCFAGPAANFLLLNSDGQDSQHRVAKKLKNKAEVVLINANGNAATSIDNIITESFQSCEQAIEYCLNTHPKI